LKIKNQKLKIKNEGRDNAHGFRPKINEKSKVKNQKSLLKTKSGGKGNGNLLRPRRSAGLNRLNEKSKIKNEDRDNRLRA